jgi:hypothetical protein
LIPKEELFRANKGQARLTESILAVGLILIIFTTSIYLMSPPKVWTIYEKGDLDRVGYNILNYLLEVGTIDNLGKLQNSTDIESQLRFLLETYLPPMTFFNFTIYNLENDSSVSTISMKIWLKVNNTKWDAFEASAEVSSTSVLYTSKDGKMYFLILMLARSGESIEKEG